MNSLRYCGEKYRAFWNSKTDNKHDTQFLLMENNMTPSYGAKQSRFLGGNYKQAN